MRRGILLPGNIYLVGAIDLPADFLSTPFGQMLRPTIDQMFRGPGNTPPAATPPRGPSAGAVVGSLLQAAASRAASGQAQTLTSHLQISTNPSSFRSLLKSHRGTVAFFTSQTCAPCKTVEPVFEELARSKARQGGVAFVKVDLGVGLGGQVASEWGVVATPTFLFFKGDKKVPITSLTHTHPSADCSCACGRLAI